MTESLLHSVFVLLISILLISPVNASAQRAHSHDDHHHENIMGFKPGDDTAISTETLALNLLPERLKKDVVQWNRQTEEIQYVDIFEGEGATPQKTDHVYVQLKVYTEDGWEIYNSFDLRSPLTYYYGYWSDYFDEAIKGMRQGGKRLIHIYAGPMIKEGFLATDHAPVTIEPDDYFFMEVSLIRLSQIDFKNRERFSYVKKEKLGEEGSK